MAGNRWACTLGPGLVLAIAATLAAAPVTPRPTASGPGAAPASPAPAAPALDARALYEQLNSAGLDPGQTYHIRDVDLDLEDVHLTLVDGTISFLQPVAGRVTGAFFQGEGEVLIIPPGEAERASLALFTGAAVLEERFSAAYLRGDERVVASLRQGLRPAENASAFAGQWQAAARELAQMDALRLLLQFTNQPAQAFLHARLDGLRLGSFDVFFDSARSEQVSVAQTGYTGHGAEYYDVWMSFPMRSARAAGAAQAGLDDPLEISSYRLQVRVLASHQMEAEAVVNARARSGGLRTLIFELSRFLKVSEVSLKGEKLEFIQNPAVPGSELARRGNDVMAVVLPRPLAAGEKLALDFRYAGSVITEAGNGLFYVGARGDWYPNRGPAMANFDIEFRYPASLTLLATGHRTSLASEGEEQVARWQTAKPIPLAGFNLGKYSAASADFGGVDVTSYSPPPPPPLPLAPAEAQDATLFHRRSDLLTPPPPLPAAEPPPRPLEQRALTSIRFLSTLWGSFPYPTLSLTPLPGPSSQGWPGLIYLSNLAYFPLPPRPAAPGGFDYRRLLYGELMPAHEIAHQWWGDAVLWKSYHDQWLMEALANYSALLEIASHDPQAAEQTLAHYRDDLIAPAGEHGLAYTHAGPVTLGTRLSSSHFPEGFERVLYERGAWLMHMLRSVLDAPGAEPGSAADPQAPFFRALRQLQERFAGRRLATADFQAQCEEFLPADVRYDGQASLDWFFTGWVEGSAVPRLRLNDVHLDRRRRQASGALLESHAPEDLVTLVPLYAEVAGQRAPVFVARVFADGADSRFQVAIPPGTKKLLLDPYNTILRRP